MNASGFKMYSRAAKDAQYELIERYAPLVKRIAYHPVSYTHLTLPTTPYV